MVELKQWSRAEVYEEKDSLVLITGLSGEPRLHPVLQVRQYCDHIADFVGALEGRRDAVRGVAYLHNAEDAAVHGLFDRVEDERTRLFTKSRRGAWLDYLRSQFAPAPGAAAADRLLRSAVRPSTQLLTVPAAEIKDREQFVLLDEQRLAYELVMHAVDRARRSDTKEVVLVTGGPGSGKSAIALSLLGDLWRRDLRVEHATGSRSFTQTLRRHAGHRTKAVKELFRYFNSFISAEPNLLDVLICDEAHRIRRTSANRFTRAADRTGRPQIDELMAAARVPVFLLDQHQVVKPNEIGTVEAIKSHAADKGYRVRPVHLDGQFRCGGSRTYEEWVLRLLGLDPAAEGPMAWPGDDRFEVVLAGSPQEMEDFLRGEAGGRPLRAHVGRLLLAMEQPQARWRAGRRRRHRRLGQTLERQE